MGDWRPDRKTAIRKDVLLWVVPASVGGRWRGRYGQDRELELEVAQRYQHVSMSALLDGTRAQVWEARLEADRLDFVIVEHYGTARESALYFQGRVAGGVIEGTVTRGVGNAREVLPWRAQR